MSYDIIPVIIIIIIIFFKLEYDRICWDHLGEMELEGIVSGQGNDEATGEKFRKRIAMVIQEERIVT